MPTLTTFDPYETVRHYEAWSTGTLGVLDVYLGSYDSVGHALFDFADPRKRGNARLWARYYDGGRQLVDVPAA